MDPHTLLRLTRFVMTAGSLLILLTGKRRTPAEALHTVLHGTGRIFYFSLCIDRTCTTPLLLVTLSMNAMHTGDRAGAIAGVVSKVVYGLMTVASDAKTTERDLAKGSRPSVKLRAAARPDKPGRDAGSRAASRFRLMPLPAGPDCAAGLGLAALTLPHRLLDA